MTPMMSQYLALKKEYPDAILFFRLGDFYEMFLDDAQVASRELGIVLTSRSKGAQRDENPMCGVPFHAADAYISKLVSRGYKVAVCEQLEDPALAKGIVKRDVVRVITPGTITDTNVLDEKSNNYLCTIYRHENNYGAAFADISTGDLFATETVGLQMLINEVARYKPSEIILNESAMGNIALINELQARFSCPSEQAKTEPEWANSIELILSRMHVSNLSELDMPDDLHVVNAVGQLLIYLESTQKAVLGNLKALCFYRSGEYMDIDIFTRRNLELTETLRTGAKRGSLLWVLDKTNTSMGGRMLKSFVEKPLLNCTDIRKRLYAVEELVRKTEIRNDITEHLKTVNDIERLSGKITSKAANAQDLLSLKQSIACLPELYTNLCGFESALLVDISKKFDSLCDIFKLIENTISYEAPVTVKEGGIINDGYDEEVDMYRDLLRNGKRTIMEMEAKERDKTGIKTLKIGYNKVFGYYIEVSKSYREMLPEGYIRKQTIANGERYITEELKDLEAKILGASERLRARENLIFCEIRDKIGEQISRLLKVAGFIATIDVLCSLAEVAVKNNYTMPYVDMSDKIEIKAGRHPVVENVLKDELFVPNDTYLDCSEDRLLIITGPNMAGKSTYMRQVAIITIMAQIGSFVPASSCSIGICDKVFTRVGASDDLSSGQSTFMVEMTEVSNILKNATQKSLLILDEIGRGTSTYDGLSIAWSVIEYVADKKRIGARTLFATHYHELTQLEDKLSGVKNYCIACKKRGDEITFLRRIIKGGADESYGIEVAALAGLPPKVIKRAKEILSAIDQGDRNVISKSGSHEDDSGQIGLDGLRGESVAAELLKLDISTLTPIEALNKLYEFQKMVLK